MFPIMMIGRTLRFGMIAASALLATGVSAAPSEIGAKTRLQRCGANTCLLVTGRRANMASPVLIAGHDVAVQGGHRWRAALPMATVKAWLPPFARSIAVDVDGMEEAAMKARLPVGLLGHDMDLAFLDVSAPH